MVEDTKLPIFHKTIAMFRKRNLFVFACLTGLRFSDFSTIRCKNIQNGMLHKKQDKYDRWFVIPLRDEAKKP